MSAFAAVTLDDGQSTPAPVVFSPSTIDVNGVARYYEGSDVFDARRSISSFVRLPSKGSQVARVQLKVVTPVMDDTTPTLKVGDVMCNVEFVIPKRATAQQRADILAFAANYLADASVVSSVTNLESIY